MPQTLGELIEMFVGMGLKIIPFLVTVAFLLFVFGVGRYIRSAGNDADRKNTKNILIWGVIGLFVLVTVWGIISFIQVEFGFGSTVIIPQIHLGGEDVSSSIRYEGQ